MISPLWVFVLIIDFITLVSGIMLNVAIIIIYMKNWRRQLMSGGVDKIVLTMALTNALLQVLLGYGGLLFSQVFLLLDVTLPLFLFTFFSFVDLCFWNTSFLSICYCLKLVNFSQKVLLWMKSRFSSAVNVLLLGSTLGSFLINSPLLWKTTWMNLNNNGNWTVGDSRLDFPLSFLLVKIIFGNFLPFLFTFLCILLSVKSLLRHIWKIQKNSSDMKYSHLQGHFGAIRTMILLLVLDLMFCVVFVEVRILSLNIGDFLGTISWIIILLYPSLQSVILITGNPKLQEHLYCQRKRSSGPSNA
ncbi:taste receptor type 2 member 4-like [Anomaloglossus baeobatrachus]|uniref:taste receptor type 2 member 4-like n=1 Tax=Anomaloglossus baeobatrachus TaxID=238106 RepID=UPI003F50C225